MKVNSKSYSIYRREQESTTHENIGHVLAVGMDIKSLEKGLCEVEVRFNGYYSGLMKDITGFWAQLEWVADLASK